MQQAVAAQVAAGAAERAAAFELERLKAALETSAASLAAPRPSVNAPSRSW